MPEVDKQRSHIYIPANKEDCWVYEYGSEGTIAKDSTKRHQGTWQAPHKITALKPNPIKLWCFLRDRKTGKVEITGGVLDNNPNQGQIAFDPSLKSNNDFKRCKPEQMWFYPPGVDLPEGIKNAGYWVKPEMKRDMSKLGDRPVGFMKVSKNYDTGETYAVKGGWNLLGAQHYVKTKDPNKDKDGKGANRKFLIHVRTHKGVVFDVPCIPGNRISVIKKKIHQKKRIPIEDQRLSFEGFDLMDEKTVAGSGIRNGDTIDLGPMHIFLRNSKGKKFTLHVEHDEAVTDVMKMVQDVEGTPVEKQILSFKRMQLQPGKKLTTYNIRHKNVIDLSGMIIYVELLSGETIELDVEPTETIRKIKTKIKNRTRIPVEEQTLFFNGRHLDREVKDLNFYNIQHLDTLVMAEEAPKTKSKRRLTDTDNGGLDKNTGMKIFIVKDWDKKKFVLHVEPNTLIEQVKEMIEKKEKIPINEQRLTFKKKSVYNKKTLEQSKIKHNALLHLSKLGKTPSPEQDDEPVAVSKRQRPDNDVDSNDPTFDVSKKSPDMAASSVSLPSPTTTAVDDRDDDPVGVSKRSSPTKPPKERNKSPPPSLRKMAPEEVPPTPAVRKQPRTLDDIVQKPNDDKDVEDKPKGNKKPTKRKSTTPRQMEDPYTPDDDPVSVAKKAAPNNKKKPKKPSKRKSTTPRPIEDPYSPDDDIVDVAKSEKPKSNKPPKRKSTPRPIEDPYTPDDNEPVDVAKDAKPPKSKKPPKRKSTRPREIEDPYSLNDKDPVNVAKKAKPKPQAPRRQVEDPYDNSDNDDPQPSDPRHVELNKYGPADINSDEDDEPDDSGSQHVEINKYGPAGDDEIDGPPNDDLGPRHVELNKYGPAGDDDSDGPPLDDQGPRHVGLNKYGPTGDDDSDGPPDDKGPRHVELNKYGTNDDDSGDVPREGGPRHVELNKYGPAADDDSDTPDSGPKHVELNKYGPRDDDTDEPEDSGPRHVELNKYGPPQDDDSDEPDDGPKHVELNKYGPRDDDSDEPGDGGPRHVELNKYGPQDDDSDDGPTHVEINKYGPQNDDSDGPYDRPKHEIPQGAPHKPLRDVDEYDSDDSWPPKPKGKKNVLDHDIDIAVTKPDGSKTFFTFPSSKTIDDVKDEIEEETGIPRARQRMFFLDGERELLPGTPLSRTELPDATGKPELEIRPLQVEIETPDGRSRTFILDPEDTVEDIRKEISKQMGEPPGRKLLRNGEYLDDDDILADVIRPGDVLTSEPDRIEIELPDKGKATLAILPSHTLEDIKDLIEEETGIPKRGQRLFYLDNDDGGELDDDMPLSKTRTEEGTFKQLKLRPPKVKVKGPGGKSRVFPVIFDETVEDFKKRVGKKLGIMPERRLLFGDVELVDDAKIADHVHHGDVLTSEPPGIDLSLPKGKVTLEPSPIKTIADVKEEIEEETGVPARAQRIFYMDGEGQELPDDAPFSKSMIKPGTNARLEVRLPEIQIMKPDGTTRSFILENPDDTVADFNRRIPKAFLGKSPARRFFVDGEELDPDEKIFNCLHHGNVLTTEPNKVDFEYPGGKATLSVLPIHTIEDIKDMIEEKTGIPKRGQRLFFLDEDDEISDEISVSKSKIGPGKATLKVRPPKVRVKGPGGKSRVFAIDFEETGEEFKNKVAAKLGLGPGRALFIDGEEIADDEKLLDNVHHGDILTTEPPEFDIQLPDGKIRLRIHPAHTIADVKDQIEQETGVPGSKQRIFFLDVDDDGELPDDLALSKTRMKAGGSLEVRIASGDEDRKRTKSRDFFIDNDEEELDEDHRADKARIQEEGYKLDIDRDKQDPDQLVKKGSRNFVLTIDPDDTVEDVKRKAAKMGLKVDAVEINTVDDVKDIVEEQLGIPKQQARVFYMDPSQELEGNAPLSREKVRHTIMPFVKKPSLEIQVEHWNGGVFTLLVEPSDYIDDVKDMIDDLQGIPVEHQRLLFNGVPVDEALTVEENGIVDGSVLSLQGMAIYVDIPEGDRISLVVQPDYEIAHIKEMVYEKTGAPERDQCLLSGGAELLDGETLSECDVEHDDVIVMELFELKIVHWLGDSFEVSGISRDDTVEKVKKAVLRKKKISLKQQRYHFKDVVVDESMSLRDQGIVHKSILTMEEPHEVEVTLPERDRVKVTIFSTTTTAEVKQVIEEHVPEITARQQRIFFFDDPEEIEDQTPFVQRQQFEKGIEVQLITFDLKIKHWNGDSYAVSMKPDEYIEDLKERIESLHGLPVFQQRLVHRGTPVDDSRTLEDQGILDRSTLHLQPMKIHIQLPEGDQRLSTIVEPEYTIAKIKDFVFSKVGIATSDQCFVSGGEELEDDWTLIESRVNHDDVLEIEIFQINVMHWDGDTFSLQGIHRNDTIERVKNRILEQRDIPLSEQRLTHNGEQIADDSELWEYGIVHKSVLVLVSPDDGDIDIPEAAKKKATLMKTQKFRDVDDDIWPVLPDWRKRFFFFDNEDGFDSKIRVMVTLMNGDMLTFDDLRLTDTVDDIKTRILKKRKHIKKKNYKLKCRGQRLDDKKSLLSQQVGHNSPLVMEPLKERHIDDLPEMDKLNLHTMPAIGIEKNITLFFKVWDGKKFQLAVSPSDYIDDVKEMIEEAHKIPVDQQRITFKKQAVDDALTLKEQSIVDKSRLVLEPMQIHVEVDGQMETYTVELDYTISKLKGLLFSKLGIPASDQVILFGADELNDQQTLNQCQVEHDDVVVLEIYQISVLHWSGETYVLSGVRRSDTMDKVRNRLILQADDVPQNQKFKFEGEPMDESKTLREQNLKHKAILTIEDASQAGVSVPRFERFSLQLFPTKQHVSSDEETFDDDDAIRLVIRHWNGKKFSIDAERTDYIDDLKDKIEALKGIPFDHQRLTFQGEPVDDTLTLKELKIVNRSRLELAPMKIHVDIAPDETTMTFEVEPDYTIAKLKGLLFSKLGIPASDQAIIDGGEELDDGQTLAECLIDHDDTVTMELFEISYVRLPGDPEVLSGVRRTDTVERIKKKVLITHKIPMDQQHFKCHGMLVDDSKTLQEQGLKHKTILILEEAMEKVLLTPKFEKAKLALFPTSDEALKLELGLSPTKEGKFILDIKTVTGGRFKLEADPMDYIDDIKERIFDLKGIPVNRQRITFKGTTVDDTLTLQDQKIGNKSRLVLEPMKINMEVPGGKTLTLTVEPDFTISKLKGLLFSKLGTPATDQCIMLGGQEVADERTLEECQVEDDDFLEMELYELSVFHWSGETTVLSGLRRIDTIAKVKKKLSLKYNTKKAQEFKFQGTPIDPTKTFKTQNLPHRAMLLMVAPASEMISVDEDSEDDLSNHDGAYDDEDFDDEDLSGVFDYEAQTVSSSSASSYGDYDD